MISAIPRLSRVDIPSFSRLGAVRTFLLPATLAVLALLSVSQAWAAAAPTTTSLTVTSGGSAVTSVAAGTVVTLTATVVSGSTPVNPGKIRFCDASAKHCEDSALLATAQLTAPGTATYKFRPGIGSHSYQAVFVGTNSYATSISTKTSLTVGGGSSGGLYPTATTIASSGSIGNYTLTATVVGTGSNTLSPTGDVSFLDTTNGNASLGTAALEATTTSVPFMTGSTLDVDGLPVYVAIADFNGDGISDLAIASWSGGTVSIFLGKGDGTFSKLSTLPAPFVGNIAVGDFNSDGIPDLVLDDSDNSLVILLGNGDGTFTTKSTITGVSGNVAVADFNGDGIPDLAAANGDYQTLTVLLGNGDGTFTTKSSGNIVNGTWFITTADFNGDGIPDLAIATYEVGSCSAGTVTVLLGNGDGTFTAKSSAGIGINASVMTSADFNGDGIPDLAIPNEGCNSTDGSVSVLLGNGDGTFNPQPSPPVGSTPSPVTAADFNGDGIPDLAVPNIGSNSVSILLGNGDGTFTAQPPINLGNNSPDYVGVGDLDGNGTQDLVIANRYTSGATGTTATVMLNQFLTETATATLSNVAVSGAETHQVEASYPGDTNFNPSNSGTLPLLAAEIATSLNLSSNTNTSVAGSQITLTATLSPYSYESFTTNGETVTFYNGGTSIGTGTLSAGVATLNTTSLPVGTDTLTAVYIGDGTFPAATSNSLTETINPTPGFVVTVTTDDATGVAANCTASGSSNCSLRDALAAAAAAGAGNITFSPTVFATAQTITLVNGGLSIPSQTTITGPTTGSGASRTNLVTVSGGGPVFTVNSGVTSAAISNLTITGGAVGWQGGGILNGGALIVSNSTISGNNASYYPSGDVQGGGIANTGSMLLINSTVTGNSASSQNEGDELGGGIENQGTLTLINSTVTGNNVSLFTMGCNYGCGVQGGGIDNQGTLTLINSTVSGNSASLFISYNGSVTGPLTASGGGISNESTLTLTNSTVAGNSVNGYGIVSNPNLDVALEGGGIIGNVTGANNIISGNTNNGSEDDCDGSGCPSNGQNGNFVGSNVPLAPLANYGGPTQTQPPLPGSTAICAGVIADIPSGTTTDQRGFPRTTTYGSNPPCVDSGSVQTNYSLSFSTEPPSTIPATTDFTAAVQVKESGNAFPVSGIGILTGLAAGDNGSLNVGSLSTNSSGIASDSQFQISAPGNDKLVATLPLTAAGVTPTASVAMTSTAINVTPSAGIEVMVGSSPAGLTFMVDGVSYTATTTLVWPLGSQHTLSTTSPQGTGGTQYTFASWSDGGAITHTVMASTSTIDYTVTFNTGYLLTTSANPSQGGTIAPASGFYPANSVLNLTATANPGYEFAGWTGNVASTSNPNTTIQMTAPEAVTASFTTIPVYTVNTNLDDSTGTTANCSSGSKSTCSLRDALAAAAAVTSGADVTFDPTVFAASQPSSARTIVLGSAGTLNVPNNARIFGPTTGSGATLTQLVTINGENVSYSPIFGTGSNTVLSGLVIADDPTFSAVDNGSTLMVIDCTISGNNGGGITNNGTLTVMGTAISGNSSSQGGGGILNEGSLTVLDSTISGNSASGTPFDASTPSGGGIYNFVGTVTIINSTISGNSDTGIVAWGGINQNVPTQFVTIVNSTISGNTGGGVNVQAGIDDNTNNQIPVALTVTDSVLWATLRTLRG